MGDLEDELRYTKENLQAALEEMETTNEELQATNEELLASNEELQSTNEELHSVNEELYTVNAEYQRKITELTELTDDMDNLLRSTEVGTIFLDRDLTIRKFTPRIAHAFHLLPQDVGRRIDSFAYNILHESLLDDVKNVLETEMPFEEDVQDRFGQWFLLRILPYRSKGKVEGVVLTLIDIARLKETEKELRRLSKVFMEGADPIIIEDLSGASSSSIARRRGPTVGPVRSCWARTSRRSRRRNMPSTRRRCDRFALQRSRCGMPRRCASTGRVKCAPS